MRKEKEIAAEPAPPDESNLPKQRWYQFKQAKSKALPQTLSQTSTGKSRAVSLIDRCSAVLPIWSQEHAPVHTAEEKRIVVLAKMPVIRHKHRKARDLSDRIAPKTS